MIGLVDEKVLPAADFGDASPGPVFIGGLAHSGKTILRLMLSSHPHLVLTRRTYMWTKCYNRYGSLAHPANFERCLTALLAQKQIRALGPNPDRLRREFWQGAPTYARLFALINQHYAETVGKPRWGDQLGFIERYAEPVLSAYPTAKMIHMIRDPRSRQQVAKSQTRYRAGKTGWDIARWLHSAELAAQNQARYPRRYRVVRYETLMAYPEDTLRQLCAFIGEDYTPAMLNLDNAIRFGDAPAAGLDPAPEWRISARASRQELAFTQRYAGGEMLAFDYIPAPIRFSWRERLLFYWVSWPANRLGMAAWRAMKFKESGNN